MGPIPSESAQLRVICLDFYLNIRFTLGRLLPVRSWELSTWAFNNSCDYKREGRIADCVPPLSRQSLAEGFSAHSNRVVCCMHQVPLDALH